MPEEEQRILSDMDIKTRLINGVPSLITSIMKLTILAIVTIGILIPAYGNDTAYADEGLDINMESAKSRNMDDRGNQSSLDISKYDFFTRDDVNVYEDFHNKEYLRDQAMKAILFTTEGDIFKDEKVAPEVYAEKMGLFSGEFDSEQINSDEAATGNGMVVIIVIIFILLGIGSFAAARKYSKLKRRKS